MEVRFSVGITPYAQPRPRVARGHAYEPAQITKYKMAIRAVAASTMRGLAPFKGLVEVDVTIRRNIKLGSRNYGDIDNHLKAVLDALNGVCYADDALVVAVTVVKEKSASEGVDIVVKEGIYSGGTATLVGNG